MDSDTDTLKDRPTVLGNVELQSISTTNGLTDGKEKRQEGAQEGNDKDASELRKICVKIMNIV